MLAPFVDPAFQQQQWSTPLLPLVGRTAEMYVIHTMFATVANDVPVGARTLTISGEMGIGKSRLLAQACQDASARNFCVLEMYAYEGSHAYPYFPFVEALRPIVRTATNDQLRFYVGMSDGVSSAQKEPFTTENLSLTGLPLVTSLARLFPELLARMQIQPLQEILSPEQEKFRLFDSIATLLERLAEERPVLLCIDNLQWVDSVSLELILYLTIRLHTSRVALIGASRPTQAQGDVEAQKTAKTVTRVLTELMQQGMWFPLPLSPLDTQTLTEHMHALLPGMLAENIVQRLLSCCEGNPFFLEELVRTLTLSGQLHLHDGVWSMKQGASIKLPESIIGAIRQRLQGISPACMNLLCVASLFGRTFPKEALVQVMEREELSERKDNNISALLDEAIQASLIAEVVVSQHEDLLDLPDIAFHIVRPQYIFCQGIVQEMLRDELPTYRVRELHYAIGQALENYYMYEGPKHAAELAAHYAVSSERGAALRWSVLAGEDAVQQQAHRKAISHFRLALQLLEAGATRPTNDFSLPAPAQLYLTIGELWFKVGEFEQSINALQAALERQDALSPLLRARTNRSLADVYRMQAKYAQAFSHLQAASTALAQQGSVMDVREQEQNLPWFFKRGTPSTSLMTLERVNSAEQVLFLQAQATLDILLNHPKEAEKALWQSHQLAIILGDRASQAFSLHLIGWLYGWGERIQDAIHLQKEAHELYIALGDPFRAALGEQGLGIIYQALGETETAYIHTQRGLKLARQYGVSRVIGWLYWNQAVIALTQGDWSHSDGYLQQALQEARKEDNARLMPVVLQAQAVGQFKRGLWHEAERIFLDAVQAAAHTDWFVSSIALYGHFLAVTGRRRAARIQLDRASSLPEPPGFSGTFYIPFLAEGYLHLDTLERATPYFERITKLRGFLYYGLSVDRVLGELATVTADWATAERAFEDGLQCCQRANNQPEEAAILYEQARMGVIRGEDVQYIRSLCEQAARVFLQYDMKRSAELVDTLLEGVQALEAVKEREAQQASLKPSEVRTSEYVIHLKLTTREREVLQLVAEGHTDREVADTLVLSPRTVNRHLSNILVKLNVPGRAAAVAYAIRQGLV